MTALILDHGWVILAVSIGWLVLGLVAAYVFGGVTRFGRGEPLN